jgi:hypothetical protein
MIAANENRTNIWRRRADELRAMAVHFESPSAKKDMLSLADQWDRLADRAAENTKRIDELAGR